MNFLLDTCILSELTKVRPDSNVTSWLASQPEERIFLSAITIGEIEKGISKLNTDSAKKDELHHWLETELIKKVTKALFACPHV